MRRLPDPLFTGVRGRIILRSPHPASRITPAQPGRKRPYCRPRVGPAATIVCAMYGYSSSWTVERGSGPAVPLDGTAHDLEHLAGYRGVGPVHHPWVAPGVAVHETSLLLDVLERPNPAPPAVDGPKRSPRSSSLIFRTPTGSPCGLLRPSPAADRRAARGLREFSYGSSRAYGRAPLVREPSVPPGVLENPGEARVRVLGTGNVPAPPFFSPPKLPSFRMRRPRTPPPLFWDATLQPAAFFGVCLKASAARTGARRGAKEC